MSLVSDELMKGEEKAYSLKLPVKFHNALKAEASLLGKSKNEFFLSLIVDGAKRYKREEKK
jgi:hypothetical protein